jgi:hypothetical protein
MFRVQVRIEVTKPPLKSYEQSHPFGPSLGRNFDQKTFVTGGVKRCSPWAASPSLGERGSPHNKSKKIPCVTSIEIFQTKKIGEFLS